MDIFPAIDVRGGTCVRLLQGDYDKQIAYNDNPSFVARAFELSGAKWVHCVDLDGARTGRPVNLAVFREIAAETSLHVQVGGGIRDEATATTVLEAGATRVIIGTMALQRWEDFERLVGKGEFAEKIVLGVDAREGRVSAAGWTEDTAVDALELAGRVKGLPLAAIVYTDIARDGMMQGPNIEAVRAMAEATDIPMIASGGVTTLQDVEKLAQLPLAGIIIGRGLYEGTVELAEALEAVSAAGG